MSSTILNCQPKKSSWSLGDLETVFPKETESVQTSVSSFLYLKNQNAQQIDQLFRTALEGLSRDLKTYSGKEKGEILFDLYRKECLIVIQKTDEYKQALQHIQKHFIDPDFVPERINELVLHQINTFHSLSIEIALKKILSLEKSDFSLGVCPDNYREWNFDSAVFSQFFSEKLK